MAQIYRLPFKAMACACEIVIAASEQTHAEELAGLAIAEVHRIQSKYSRYQTESLISKINASAGLHPVDCDQETLELFAYADTVYELSEGLFDITAGILRRAWRFEQSVLPSPQQLADLCALINWQAVQRNKQQIFLPVAGMEIDFGGFGKEYAADKAAAVLLAAGAQHGYVNLGGDIQIFGPKPDGEAWSIGIQNPRDINNIVAAIPLRQGGLASSGDYERFFELDGQRYCHILNPKSGMPVSYWSSVSVLAPQTLMAGSYTTIAMLLEERGLAFLNTSGLSYLAVNGQGIVHLKK
jgi:thiamine biosynthesis lipoprotein